MEMRTWLMSAAIFVLTANLGVASEDITSVENLSWLAGHWRGEGLGGECEEIWSAPMAGTMVGTFRLMKDGEVQFYELLVLTRDGDDIVMKVKHFTREFVGWEKKEDAVSFVLDHVEPNHARFKGLTLRRAGDALDIELTMRRNDGTIEQEPFQFRRYEP